MDAADNLFPSAEDESDADAPTTSHLFVDEAGDPNLFANRRTAIVGREGCSRFFIIGKLEVADPNALSGKLKELRDRLCRNVYFSGVPSFDPKRRKTALAFHAKDDLPEVRFQVLDLLTGEGSALRFHAVVCDKLKILDTVLDRNEKDPDYWYHPNELYDQLMRSLFGKLHRLADFYRICIARRGTSDRTAALREAIDRAEEDFVGKFGFNRGAKENWTIDVSTPECRECIQAVDYFLWALQRAYECRRHEKTGEEIREDRFLRMLWPQIGEIHDLHFGPSYGTFFNARNVFSVAARFPPPPEKKKKP